VEIGELGEFGLIARLTQGLKTRKDVALGVGDDAAVLTPPPGSQLVATCDALVAGQHFTFQTSEPAEIGHKALAVNLSDVAAMGAEPLWALVSLHLPSRLESSTLDALYGGIRALARRFDVAIVGGNITATTGPLTIDITLLGACPTGRAITRAGGQPGDALVLVGTLGAATAGLLVSTERDRLGGVAPEMMARARHAQVAPEPLVETGRALAATGTLHAMIDVSDGLAGDLSHLCAASGVGALLEARALPVDPAAGAIASALGREALTLAITGGEDYALLCAVAPESVAATLAAVTATGAAVSVIGKLTAADEGLRIQLSDGSVASIEASGWDHLRGAWSSPGRGTHPA
jgi:thiamine-monophosphate kinase